MFHWETAFAIFINKQKSVLKEIIYEISNDINAGLSLSQSLERQNRIFSDFYLNMIKSAEVTGRLEEAMVFGRLS